MTTALRPMLSHRPASAVACVLLAACAVLALQQRDLLDPARMDDGPIAAARLVHERQRYGPGDAGEFERIVRERGADEAERVFDGLMELAPTWPAYRYAAGLVAMARETWEDADARFEEARRLAPNDAGLAERMGAAWVRVAAERKEPKLILYGLPHFAAAARLDPNMLRQTFRLLEPFAIDPGALTALVPDTPAGHREFGVLLADAGRPGEAIAQLERAVADPESAGEDAWFALGRSHLALGHVEEAEAAFIDGVARSADPTARVRELYDVFARAGRGTEGRGFWQHLAETVPRGARFNLGRTHFDEGPSGYASAVTEFRAIEDVVRDPATTGYLARIEIEGRLLPDARARLERALRIHPRDADLHYLLALTLRGLGDGVAARGELGRARELVPANETFTRLAAAWSVEDQAR